MSTSSKPRGLRPWWGRFDVPLGDTRHFRIGPCALWIERRPRELRITRKQYGDPLDAALVVDSTQEPVPQDPDLDAQRYASSGRATTITLQPALADRPVVVRTAEPFHVLGDDEAMLYLTTPLWIRMSAGEAHEKLLFDIPAQRPSDTWFGRNTRDGQLCYAGTTTAKLNLQELVRRPNRAVTQLRIVNQARTPLMLDRISLPAPALSLHEGHDHRLWTEPVEVTRELDGAIRGVTIVRLSIAEGAPVPLSGPRDDDPGNLFLRAFKALLS
jgi:hypothetical protein